MWASARCSQLFLQSTTCLLTSLPLGASRHDMSILHISCVDWAQTWMHRTGRMDKQDCRAARPRPACKTHCLGLHLPSAWQGGPSDATSGCFSQFQTDGVSQLFFHYTKPREPNCSDRQSLVTWHVSVIWHLFKYNTMLLSFFRTRRQLTSFMLLTHLVSVLCATPPNMVVLRTNWKFIFWKEYITWTINSQFKCIQF